MLQVYNNLVTYNIEKTYLSIVIIPAKHARRNTLMEAMLCRRTFEMFDGF
jgi:hypothetical protein